MRPRNRSALLLAAALITPALLGQPAEAATTSHLHAVDMGYGDVIYNFDFNSADARADNVDWAVSLLFTRGASINKVKNIVADSYSSSGGAKAARLNDGAGLVYDQDSGKKTGLCSLYGQETRHFRVYADGDDRMYNTKYGYYVFGTTHVDSEECTPSAYFGQSERTEHDLATKFSAKGYTVHEDSLWLDNREQNRVEGNHRWDNDGYATVIEVP